MAKDLKYNIKISVDGKEMVVASVRDVSRLNKEIDLATSSSSRFNDAMKNLSNTAMTLQGITGALNQINSVFNAVTEESRSFASSMKAANTMAGKDAAGFEKLKDQVAELSKTIPLTREELANGLYQVISNGVPENNWIDYLNASARSAVGGIANVGEVVKVTSTVIKNYGLEWSAAQDIQDKIQLTAKNGVTSFEQLAAALPSVTGQAAQLGVSFTEMLAVMSTLTGVTGNTSEVATQLSSVLTALTKESSKAQKMAAEMGIEFNAASIKAAGGLQNFIVQLDRTVTEYANKTGELRESIYSQLFGRAEALRLVSALTGNLAGKFAENIEQLEESAGTINESFDTMASTGSSKIQMMKNSIGGFTDAIASAFGSILPYLNITSQLGMTAASFTMLGQSLAKLGFSARIASGAMSVLGAKTFTTFKALTLMMTGSRGAAIAVGALAASIRMLLISTGIGIALWGISAAMEALSGSSEKATKAMEDNAHAAELLKSGEDAAKEEAARHKLEIDKEIKSLKELIDSKKDTTAAIDHLNQKYGESFGVYSTAAQWYDTLVSKSKIYCRQKGYEAQVIVWATELAKKEMELDKNNEDRADLWRKGLAQKPAHDAWVDSDGREHKASTTKVDTDAYTDLKKKGASLISDIKTLRDNIDKAHDKMDDLAKQLNTSSGKGAQSVDMLKMSYKELGEAITKQKDEVGRLAGKEGMEKEAVAAAMQLSKMEARYKTLGKKFGLSSGGSSSGEKEPKFYTNPSNDKEYRKNISYYSGQLKGDGGKGDKEIMQRIRLWQREIDLIDLAKKKAALPVQVETVEDAGSIKRDEEAAKSLEYLTAKRKLASDDEVKVIDKVIEAVQRKQKAMEMESRIDIDDDKIETYSELNKKREYYNYLVSEGSKEEIKKGREGLAVLDEVQKKLDKIGRTEPSINNLKTIEDYDKAISFYTEEQKTADASRIQELQLMIENLTKGRDALQIGIELPSMQKEMEEINELSGREYRIKVNAIGFDRLTEEIREINKMLSNPSLSDSYRKQLEEYRSGLEKMRKDAALSFSTLTGGWDSIKGVGNAIEGISSALEGNANAWQMITSVVDGAIQIYQGIAAIVQIIDMITMATQAHTVAKTAETAATIASTTATGVEAGVQEGAALATVPVIAANKAATASFLQLAAAEYMAAHAYIPFAGFGIGAGFSIAAAALVESMGLMMFANGGVVSGPTLGLIGEYAGASNNPEVVAPLDKLRSMIQPQQVALPPGSVIGKVQGRDILLVAANTSRISAKSGHRTNIKG